jgi:hypothetical protein
MTSPASPLAASTSCLLPIVALPAARCCPLCVGGLGARGGRGRSRYSRCDCHFLHLGTEEQKEQWERQEHLSRQHRSSIWLAGTYLPGVHIRWCGCGWGVGGRWSACSAALICI